MYIQSLKCYVRENCEKHTLEWVRMQLLPTFCQLNNTQRTWRTELTTTFSHFELQYQKENGNNPPKTNKTKITITKKLWAELHESRLISHKQGRFWGKSRSSCSMASLLPAFASRLFWQPEPHQASHLLRVTLSLAVVEVVQQLVVPSRCQQTQVRARVMVGLLLGTAVLLSCYL